MDKIPIIIVVAVVIAGALFWAFQAGFFVKVEPPVNTNGIILFYGEGCPHCKNVDDFIAQNKIEDKVKFERLEVWNNKNNQATLASVASSKCGFASDQIGVPFLYDGNNKCYIGDIDVINFFKDVAGIK